VEEEEEEERMRMMMMMMNYEGVLRVGGDPLSPCQ
jgi:hypothetical protein